jgi:hypothetical protein
MLFVVMMVMIGCSMMMVVIMVMVAVRSRIVLTHGASPVGVEFRVLPRDTPSRNCPSPIELPGIRRSRGSTHRKPVLRQKKPGKNGQGQTCASLPGSGLSSALAGLNKLDRAIPDCAFLMLTQYGKDAKKSRMNRSAGFLEALVSDGLKAGTSARK